MTVRKHKAVGSGAERAPKPWSFWLASAITPDSVVWGSGGISRSLAGEMDAVRRSGAHAGSEEACAGVTEPASAAATPAEAPRRAA